MNEWKSCFFSSRFVFFFRQKSRMNEWHLNFSVEKKKNKKTHKNSGKKTQATFIKKKGNFIKIWLNDRWTFPGKKKAVFFSPLREKKKLFWILSEWVTPKLFPVKKKTAILTFYTKIYSFNFIILNFKQF